MNAITATIDFATEYAAVVIIAIVLSCVGVAGYMPERSSAIIDSAIAFVQHTDSADAKSTCVLAYEAGSGCDFHISTISTPVTTPVIWGGTPVSLPHTAVAVGSITCSMTFDGGKTHTDVTSDVPCNER